MKYRLKVFWYYLEVFFSRFLRLFNIRYSTTPIPKETLYCYVWDEERNKYNLTDGYWTKPCKYYRCMEGYKAGCTYVGFIGFSLLLSDQCKICNTNENISEDE